ncbi:MULTISPECIES: SDR family NAD(P)-dependent oxidoreductase [Weeksella]|uniref:SDR family NAD(P)-dependent oxidoreductase n=1 Tax=Weeksella TaxID=1013 RepID=UPI0008BFDAB8|nr:MULTISPECIES: SDR family NAD(P)-dependent oxidoreductase [Weeksella]MDK7374889.1 SDR family NAD(P)-dependent oxidoreductase [Weeksella virosa]MDK7675468.1 SDR family NAD(P)-dependent oxidoreductase [Weeksella virosa]OFM83914.1 short-chain dehydrogenase [Weeksella sp. HMSC059D05]SUP54438.1 Cyclopentanol dehydrogenase [Weeksella virosa]
MQQKVIVITGSSAGVGLTLANYFQSKGHIVYGLSRTMHGKETFHHLPTDVTNKENVYKSIETILHEQKRIDVLINNAGIGMLGAVEDASKEDVDKLFNVNIFGSLYTIQAVLPHMRAQKYGWIFNVSSIASNHALPFRGYYSASKSVIDRLTEALRLENRKTGVEIATLNFGDIRTNIAESRVKSTVSAFHKDKFFAVVEEIDKEVENGTPPEKLIPIIEKLLNKKNLKPHYYIGKRMQKLSVRLKYMLSQKRFENILAKYSKMN